jgi:predicted ATP-grasp superfamily ATP-dependent carboligase
VGPKILITDGTERAALAAARALVAAGYEVHVAAARQLSLAGVSRGVQRCLLKTDPFADASGYAAELSRIITDRGIGLLLPVTDVSVEAVLEHRHLLPLAVALPLPDLATYRRASDKLQVLELARSAGFAVPETVVLDCRDQDGIWPDGLFPAVVKPHRSVVTVGGKRRAFGVTFVRDSAECRRALALLPPAAFPVLLQRRIAGVGEGLFALRWEGRTVARFAHRRLREKPPAGGVSVYRESIAPDPRLVSAGERLLDALDWKGVAMIECKRDPDTGRHVIMEVNGRFWGSVQLAIDAGIDFPVLLVRCALGQARAEPTETGYRIGVRSRWFWGDVDHLYLRLTRSLAQLQVGDDYGSRLAAVLRFLAFHPGRDRCEVWRWGDPAPFLLETSQRIGLVR